MQHAVDVVQKGATMLLMAPAKKKSEGGEDSPKKKYPSRAKLKYVYIPLEQWEALHAIGEPIERSVSWLVKQAVREYLERQQAPG